MKIKGIDRVDLATVVVVGKEGHGDPIIMGSNEHSF